MRPARKSIIGRAVASLGHDIAHSRHYKRLLDLLKFDEAFYLRYHADVRTAVAGQWPVPGFRHYLRHGIHEGRSTHNEAFRLLESKLGGGLSTEALNRVDMLEQKLQPIPLGVDSGRETTVNVFLPTLDSQIFFGGYIAFFHFLCRLAEQGVRLRLIALEDIQASGEAFLRGISDRPRWCRAFRRAEFVNMTSRRKALFISANDVNIAYSAWCAFVAHQAASRTLHKRFVFFIQEHEAAFHRHDSLHFIVDSAYLLPHIPIYNSRALHDYFKVRKLGVFSGGCGEQLWFEHAITAARGGDWTARRSKRLLFYARPEFHAGRNLFEVGILALREAVRKGIIDSTWEVLGIGSLVREYSVPIADGMTMRILPRVPEASTNPSYRASA